MTVYMTECMYPIINMRQQYDTSYQFGSSLDSLLISQKQLITSLSLI